MGNLGQAGGSFIKEDSLSFQLCAEIFNFFHHFMDNILILIIAILKLTILCFILLKFRLITVMSPHLISQIILLSLLTLLQYPFKNALKDTDK